MNETKNTYCIPVKLSEKVFFISDPNAHSDFLQYAIDIPLHEGTEILAARSGKVVGVHIDSNEGGIEKKYREDPIGFVNWITIEHENEELSQYFHLKYNGSVVKVGDQVNVGDLIGYSGNTGLSTDPHLHFHVCVENNTDVGWETLKIKFDKKIKIIRNISELNLKEKKILSEFFDN